MKQIAISILLILAARLPCTAATEDSAGSPASFISKQPIFYEMDGSPSFPMEWTFSTNGTFKAGSLTSSFSYTITGSWVALSNGVVEISGESRYSRTKETNVVASVITSIVAVTTNTPPAVLIQRTDRTVIKTSK